MTVIDQTLPRTVRKIVICLDGTGNQMKANGHTNVATLFKMLDLNDPTLVIGHLEEPLLSPAADEREGYVPNVVYSCGGLLWRGTLVIPYGIADTSTSIATLRWNDLRARLLHR